MRVVNELCHDQKVRTWVEIYSGVFVLVGAKEIG